MFLFYLFLFLQRQDYWGHYVLESNYRLMPYIPNRYRSLGFRSFALPVPLQENPLIKSTSLALTRSCDTLLANPATSLVFTAVGIIVFALWVFLPLMRDIRNCFDVCFCYMQPYLYDYILG